MACLGYAQRFASFDIAGNSQRDAAFGIQRKPKREFLFARKCHGLANLLVGLQQRRSGAPSLQNADVAVLRELLQSSPADAAQLRQMLIEGTLSNADAFILARVLIEAGDRESLNSVMQSLRAAAMAALPRLARKTENASGCTSAQRPR